MSPAAITRAVALEDIRYLIGLAADIAAEAVHSGALTEIEAHDVICAQQHYAEISDELESRDDV